MNDREPLAYFITFTVYGTFLQGDSRGWVSRRMRAEKPQPLLQQWHRRRLRYDVLLLTPQQRSAVEKETRRLCEFRGWTLWEVNARTNHVHSVISAFRHSGETVRNQLKANCTRALRERWPVFANRPVWSVGGDWQCINSEHDLNQVVLYAGAVQDRKSRDGTK